MSNGSATTTPVSLSHASAQHAAVTRKKVKIQRFKKKDLIHLFRGLSSMLKAQINTSDALKYYGQGLPNKAMASALEQIRFDTESGMSIHEAFRRTGRFDDMTIGLIQAGGDSGQLNRAFRELDATMVEIDPLVVAEDGHLLALDAKMGFDDGRRAGHRLAC